MGMTTGNDNIPWSWVFQCWVEREMRRKDPYICTYMYTYRYRCVCVSQLPTDLTVVVGLCISQTTQWIEDLLPWVTPRVHL